MNKDTFFSIITPTYNRAALLSRAIKSVLNQKYKNFELIIVDDGSTDNTEEIVKRFSQSDSRVIYLKKKHEERSIARNWGVKNAKGDYIGFLDSDDTLYPHHLSVAEKVISDLNNPEIFHLGYDYKNENDEIINAVSLIEEDIYSRLLKGNFMSCNGVFIRKDIALAFPFIEDADFSIMEDWALWLKIGLRYPIKHIPEITSTVYEHKKRSVLVATKDRLLLNRNLFIKYVFSDIEFSNKLIKYKKRLQALTYTYIALHLSLNKKYIFFSLKILTKAIYNDFSTLFHRRFYAALKHLIIPASLDIDLRKLFFISLYYTGLGHLIMSYQKMNYKIPILVFHRISPYTDDFWNPISPEQFKFLVDFLANKYTFISLGELLNNEKGKLRNCCAVTFDDAFEDFFQFAVPIITQTKIPISMFVPVDCVNKKTLVWTSQLDNCFKYTKKKEIILTINNKQKHFSLQTRKQRIKTAFQVQKLLLELPNEQFKDYLEKIIHELGENEDPYINIMSWEEIIRTSSVINYQSHSMTHAAFSKIEDETALNYEIIESKNMLAKNLNNPIEYIAFPMGDYSGISIDIIKKHYQAAFASNNDLVDLKKIGDASYKYIIPRFNVDDKNPFELFFRINGFHRFFGR